MQNQTSKIMNVETSNIVEKHLSIEEVAYIADTLLANLEKGLLLVEA